MHTISGAAKTRAAARRRAASTTWAQRARSVRSRLRMESPLGMAVVGIGSVLILAAALFPLQFVPFTFALRSLIGLGAYQQLSTDSRVGEIVFTPVDGNACRKVLFDNRTGSFGPDQHIRCYVDVSVDRDGATRGGVTSDRFGLLRQAFTTSPAR